MTRKAVGVEATSPNRSGCSRIVPRQPDSAWSAPPCPPARPATRYRKTQIAERQREANRLHKALEDTGIKLDDCVATDILGASGRAMLDALVAGTTDPQVLADLAKGKLRAKLPALREALEGRFEATMPC